MAPDPRMMYLSETENNANNIVMSRIIRSDILVYFKIRQSDMNLFFRKHGAWLLFISAI